MQLQDLNKVLAAAGGTTLTSTTVPHSSGVQAQTLQVRQAIATIE